MDSSQRTPRNPPRRTSQGTPQDPLRRMSQGTPQGSPGGAPRQQARRTSQGTPQDPLRRMSQGTPQGSPGGAPRQQARRTSQGTPQDPRMSEGTPQGSPGGAPRQQARRTSQGTPQPSEHHHPQLINENDPWMNYYCRDPTERSESLVDNPSRNRVNTLYHWQNLGKEVECALKVQENSESTPAYFVSKSGSRLLFSIEGGSHNPAFLLRYNFKTESEIVRLLVHFPLFTNRNNNHIKNPNPSIQPTKPLPIVPDNNNIEFTFSDGLRLVNFKRRQLTGPEQSATGFEGANKHWIISWRSSEPPVVVNFGANLGGLNNEQRQLAQTFRKIYRADNMITMISRVFPSKLGSNIAYWINMPQQTPPCYPQYDCRFNTSLKQVVRISVPDVPELYAYPGGRLELSDAGKHFIIRKPGWQGVPPDKISTVIDLHNYLPQFASVGRKGRDDHGHDTGNTAVTISGSYLSEREYEVTQLVGMARDYQFCEKNLCRLFNQRYTFDLRPAGLTTRETGVITNEFYIFINVRPTARFAEQMVAPPNPGVRVSIKPVLHTFQDSLQRARDNPMMATNLSGMHNALVKYDKSQLTRSGSGKHISGARGRNLSTTSEGKEPKERVWHGVVVPRSGPGHDEFDIAIYVILEDTGLGYGLQDCSADFTFGNISLPYKQVQQAVHLITYGEDTFYEIPRDNWVKTLLFARENDAIGRMPRAPPPQFSKTIPNILLNPGQQQAFNHSISEPQASANTRLVLIRAPAGTGKTLVATQIAYHSYHTKQKLLMSAGSNYAVDTMADSVFSALFSQRPATLTWQDRRKATHRGQINFQAPQGIWGIYRLEKEADEHFTNFVNNAELGIEPKLIAQFSIDEITDVEVASQPYRQSAPQNSVDDDEYRAIDNFVKYRATTGRRLSLGDHILARIRKLRHEKSAWIPDHPNADLEYIKLLTFIGYRIELSRMGYQYADLVGATESERVATGIEMSEHIAEVSQRSLAAWRDLQAFYISDATIILVTATTAGRKTMRRFNAQRVLVDEAAQLTEPDCLNPIVRHFSTLEKVILIGDPKQLQPIVPSRGQNEFYDERTRSLMTRMEDSGIRPVCLTEQRRMDPQIASFVSQVFYNGILTSHTSVYERDGAQRFRNAAVASFKAQNISVSPSVLYFVNIPNSKQYHRTNCTSLINPSYVGVIMKIFSHLYTTLDKHANGDTVKFAIMSYYAEEIAMLRRLVYQIMRGDEKRVSVISVDASQGKEYDVVLLSTCRKGGPSGLGFVADLARMNVALSRARHGLIVFGDQEMGKLDAVSQSVLRNVHGGLRAAFKAWNDLVEHCRARKTLVTFPHDGAVVLDKLNINLKDWVELGRSGNTFNSL